MSKINATIVADSVNEYGDRITSYLLTYPRIIHSELMTHRMFSRNSASSRAIPFNKMVEAVDNSPFVPIAWQRGHSGMQGTQYLTAPIDLAFANDMWIEAKNKAVKSAKNLYKNGTDGVPFVTKQICNRLLEPFMWHTTLVTATEFENFFELRCPQYWVGNPLMEAKNSWKDLVKEMHENGFDSEPSITTYDTLKRLQFNQGQSEIHISLLAEAMWDVRNESIPKKLKAGGWHIPFEDKIDMTSTQADCFKHLDRALTNEELSLAKVKLSTAMCARTSYTLVGEEKEVKYETLLGIHDKMVNAKPFHASPFEHCAKAMTESEHESFYSGEGANERHVGRLENHGWCRNFKGFIQYRHILENGEGTSN